jgi:hypothetical protein
MTADGSMIYFTTATALVEADHNTVADVYQWHEGQLRLITTGATGADPSQAYGTTPSGRDVFIISDSRLSEADTDDLYDIYDVRVGGGFDPPGTAGAGCSGEACQGPAPPVPAAAVTGSVSVDGRGNQAATARPFSATAPKKVTGRTLVVRLRVPSAGHVTVHGRFVKKAARVLSKAGSYRIKVALTAAGKRNLRQRTSLSTRLRVTFAPGSGATVKRTVQVTFKQPKAKKTRTAHGR